MGSRPQLLPCRRFVGLLTCRRQRQVLLVLRVPLPDAAGSIFTPAHRALVIVPSEPNMSLESQAECASVFSWDTFENKLTVRGKRMENLTVGLFSRVSQMKIESLSARDPHLYVQGNLVAKFVAVAALGGKFDGWHMLTVGSADSESQHGETPV